MTAARAQHGVAATPRRGKDYGYSNARVRGMKSRLLDMSFFEGLMESPDMRRIIADLSETEYGTDLDKELLHGRTAQQVDEALKDNLVRTYQKVLGFLEGEGWFIVRTLLGRWDLFNLKTIIRGKHLAMPTEEILTSLMPAGQMSEIELEALAKVSDVRAVVDTLATWESPYAEPLNEAIGAYVQEGDVAAVELGLDRYYAHWAHARLSRRNSNFVLARRILSVQIDTINLMTAMRLQKADVEELEVERFFLDGGADIYDALFVELAHMSDIDEMLDRLKGTQYGQILEEAAVQYVEVGSIAVFERVLEDYLMRRAVKMGVGDPLGAGVVISYLWAKHNEVQNLRIIVKGKSVGMPAERVRKELILV
jgi:V/A-type H+-transporting ATPase subunit C